MYQYIGCLISKGCQSVMENTISMPDTLAPPTWDNDVLEAENNQQM